PRGVYSIVLYKGDLGLPASVITRRKGSQLRADLPALRPRAGAFLACWLCRTSALLAMGTVYRVPPKECVSQRALFSCQSTTSRADLPPHKSTISGSLTWIRKLPEWP